jgi:anaerobic magnesium-protoporphyrin IX monomethyl ester cyclase
MWRALRGLNRYDSDFINALFLTPYHWTALGSEVHDGRILEKNLWKWDCRHPIVAQKQLSPWQAFFGAKLMEAIYQLHPKRLWRSVTVGDPGLRRQFRYAYGHIAGVFLDEIREFVLDRIFT